jgi:AcrR family transcriptional regulator
MSEDVKAHRTYHAPQRTEHAVATRRAVLSAARELFTTRGYAATTVAQLAEHAGVNVDTLYAAVGRKPTILRELVETALSGTDRTVPAAERDYVRAIQAATTAREKIEIYAAALAAMGPRTTPIFLALREAALRDTTALNRGPAPRPDRRRGRRHRLEHERLPVLRAAGQRARLDPREVRDAPRRHLDAHPAGLTRSAGRLTHGHSFRDTQNEPNRPMQAGH